MRGALLLRALTRGAGHWSDALELLERLAAVGAVVDRAAQGRAERVLERRVARAAVRALGDRQHGAARRGRRRRSDHRRREAAAAQPLASGSGDALARPRLAKLTSTSTRVRDAQGSISRSPIRCRMTSMAGQPTKVGSSSTSAAHGPPSSTRTSPMTPRSTRLMAGISGSGDLVQRLPDGRSCASCRRPRSPRRRPPRSERPS